MLDDIAIKFKLRCSENSVKRCLILKQSQLTIYERISVIAKETNNYRSFEECYRNDNERHHVPVIRQSELRHCKSLVLYFLQNNQICSILRDYRSFI